MDLDWIKHFNIYIKNRFTGAYRMLIIDNYKSHIPIEFNNYCKFNNIIIINISAHLSHLLQLLDIGIFSFLKAVYDH